MDSAKIEYVLRLQLDWIRAADAKVPPLFAVNLAMLGVTSALIKTLDAWSIIAAVMVALCLLPLATSMIFLTLALFPRLHGPRGSNIFFGGIAQQDAESYCAKMKGLSGSDYEGDVLKQVHRNAEIAACKYSNIKWAFTATLISVVPWLLTIYILYVQEG